jgi:hypothetical protein
VPLDHSEVPPRNSYSYKPHWVPLDHSEVPPTNAYSYKPHFLISLTS